MRQGALQEDPVIGASFGGPEAPGETESLERAQRGDRAAFERLYRAHVGRVLALVTRMTGKTQEAEEMTQEVFMRAWQKLDTFSDADHFGAWLHRVAVNLVLNERRRWVRRNRPEVVDRLEQDETHSEGTPGERVDLERAIAALPDGARTVLVLHDIHGYRHDEIAGMTGRAVGTTKAQLHRARRRLREVMGR
jgi:RNA polymerase sigma-70 factor (ECF subfamily)